ncbi:MAG TPA: 6-phosphofructokinase [Candidatus Saccharimonadales bacterium]|nr:6-phosphofructokinase [Candidatus Saccharimonadales bacterium]
MSSQTAPAPASSALAPSKVRCVGILTAGGDCPGLNAVIRAVYKTAHFRYGMDVIGIEDGFAGALENRMKPLDMGLIRGILPLGGTILGSSNRDDPFRVPHLSGGQKTYEDRSDDVLSNLQRAGVQALVAVGGDGTLTMSYKLSQKGLSVVGVPKTIDNDLSATDVTFGFDSALRVATQAVDMLHTTAEAHHRVMVVEVMGRYAGWIALESAMAGGADIVLIPEIPFHLDRVYEQIRDRLRRGSKFSIVVVGEGAKPAGGSEIVQKRIEDSTDPIRLGGIGNWLAQHIEEETKIETRVTVLGHLQRSGPPTPFDRVLGTRLGVMAADLVARGEFGRMASLRGTEIVSVPLQDAVAQPRNVNPDGSEVRAARAVGMTFGD